MRKPIIFLNGKFIKVKVSFVDFLVPGQIEGRGVFETMKVDSLGILAWPRHYQRLKKGCLFYRMKAIPVQKEFQNIIKKILQMNELRFARVRIMIFEQRDVQYVSLTALPIKTIAAKKYQQGFKVSVEQMPERKKQPAYLKSLDYHAFREAYQSARNQGFDEAVLTNSQKQIVEGTRSNIFFVKADTVYTPSLTSGCLDGITRNIILGCLKKLKRKYVQKRIYLKELKAADEIFLTSSVLGVMPVTQIENKRISSGRMGEITRQIFLSYKKIKPTVIF
ncbi:MAG: aminotransferase class IV [Candidatus Omnitrophica bacterium]|nr:aminotransferase class IV [Candidatus Omnitrophota bacterium]